MLQMVFDPSGITHAAGRDDYLGIRVEINIFRILAGYRNLQSVKSYGIDSPVQKLCGFFVKIPVHSLSENVGSLHCQRTVYPDLEALMIFYHALFLDLPDKVQHFLCSAHRKGRNNHISAPVKGSLDDLRQFHCVICRFFMASVPVGGLHHHIISP